MDLFVSSSCVRADRISEALRLLLEAGFRQVELSGGTLPYANLTQDLAYAVYDHGMRLIPHNYFPPPEEAFVINLASLDTVRRDRSVAHLVEGIRLSASLGEFRFGFHAGFLFDVEPSELGRPMSATILNPREAAWEHFVDSLGRLKEAADRNGVQLYVENNVLSLANSKAFGARPFLGLDAMEMRAIAETGMCTVLADFAHLRVSCQSLGMDFAREANALVEISDYWHVSGNDGRSDTNGEICIEDPILTCLQNSVNRPKIITLEVYDGLSALRRSADVVKRALR